MAYRIEADESVGEAVRRIACEETDKTLKEIAEAHLDLDLSVHQARKRCKRIRSLIRLIDPKLHGALAKQNKRFRNSARRLAGLRDAASVLECLDGLRESCGDHQDIKAFNAVRQRLAARRADVQVALEPTKRLASFTKALGRARERIEGWGSPGVGFKALKGGVATTYQQAKRAMTHAYADPSAEAFHTWRKRAKDHAHHMRILQNAWEPEMTARRDALDRLADLLGDEHDLGELRAVLAHEPGRFTDSDDVRLVLARIDVRRAERRSLAHPLGRRLFAESPRRFADRIECYWRAWAEERTWVGRSAA